MTRAFFTGSRGSSSDVSALVARLRVCAGPVVDKMLGGATGVRRGFEAPMSTRCFFVAGRTLLYAVASRSEFSISE